MKEIVQVMFMLIWDIKQILNEQKKDYYNIHCLIKVELEINKFYVFDKFLSDFLFFF
jgi:hypothetical protein